MSRRAVWARVGAATAALAVAGAALTACGNGDESRPIGYLIDARVDTYNANTLDGASGGALMAFARVLPGFSFQGAQGQTVADLDVGTATVREGAPGFVVDYEFSPDAVFSDGTPMTCDDLVLAATAMAGYVPDFDQASRAGYRDIAHIDCEPGSKSAAVSFGGEVYADWQALFGPGTLLPAHVVGAKAGVPDVVGAVTGNDREALGKLANAWNTAFALTPGQDIDPAVFVASGPYRLDAYTADGGLKLVRNDSWWGDAPATGEIVIYPRGTEQQRAVDNGEISVTDTADLSMSDAVLGIDPASPGGADSADRAQAGDVRPLTVEQLVPAPRGVLADGRVRRALAMCIPRDSIARAHGANGQLWNLRTVAPATTVGTLLNGQFGGRYPRTEPDRARELLAERPGDTPVTVRIGYVGPDPVRSAVVEAIAESCGPAGIEVTDIASENFSVNALQGDADAVLISGGAWFAAGGTAAGIRDSFALHRSDPSNIGRYDNTRVSAAIDELSLETSDSARLPGIRGIETTAWDQLATIPLYGTVRGRGGVSVQGVEPGLGSAGTGWNMDRWRRA